MAERRETRTDPRGRALPLAAALGLALLFVGTGAGAGGPAGQAPARAPHADWRPGADTAGVRYVGSEVCATCHTDEASTYLDSPMARAAEPASDCEILAANPRLTFREGPYTYTIARQGGGSLYTVGDGTRTISAPILYCFGRGVAGQTYIFRHGGSLYESRVSYFERRRGLDLTILHPRAVPASLEEAVGRPMGPDAARGCFNCHTTGGVEGDRFDLDRLAAGVGCEACHGPGERHVAVLKAEKEPAELHIFNPASLDALDMTQEFCGSCHMSFEKVMMMPDQGGLANIRFQPYRIFKSRGHFVDDRRMSCVACHDPHAKVAHEPAFYDAKCLACHVSSAKEARTPERAAGPCPVAARDCVTCHMPKVELPEMHHAFSDHWIRVAKPGGPVPN